MLIHPQNLLNTTHLSFNWLSAQPNTLSITLPPINVTLKFVSLPFINFRYSLVLWNLLFFRYKIINPSVFLSWSLTPFQKFPQWPIYLSNFLSFHSPYHFHYSFSYFEFQDTLHTLFAPTTHFIFTLHQCSTPVLAELAYLLLIFLNIS